MFGAQPRQLISGGSGIHKDESGRDRFFMESSLKKECLAWSVVMNYGA
jgi:hypothetical protein